MAGEFNLDKAEYEQVFRVFDKDSSGEINIDKVYDIINQFEQSAKEGSASGQPSGG